MLLTLVSFCVIFCLNLKQRIPAVTSRSNTKIVVTTTATVTDEELEGAVSKLEGVVFELKGAGFSDDPMSVNESSISKKAHLT